MELRRGRNQLLLKVQNVESTWGYVLRVLGPHAQVDKLIQAFNRVDMDRFDHLQELGTDINARSSCGLTPAQAAWLTGRPEVLAHLIARGARPARGPPSLDGSVQERLGCIPENSVPGVALPVARNGKILYEGARALRTSREIGQSPCRRAS